MSDKIKARVRVEYAKDFGLNAVTAERTIHVLLAHARLDGEWFSCGVDAAKAAIDVLYASMGHRVKNISPF